LFVYQTRQFGFSFRERILSTVTLAFLLVAEDGDNCARSRVA
jgi:hypothetical protein